MMRSNWQVCLSFSLVILGLFPLNSPAMSVQEAYQAIPHERTVFRGEGAMMSDAEKEFLEQFFNIIDYAVVERVETMLEIRRQGKADAKYNYDHILAWLDQLEVPDNLKQVHQLVREAIVEQRSFLEEWKIQNNGDIAGDPQVQSSSQKLKQAYGLLIGMYPEEGQNNKQAFFDYLCALDFI